MDVRSLITLFGQEAGTSLALSDAGTVSLVFEAGPTVQLEHDPLIDALQCYVVLGRAPEDPAARHDVFRRMLAANVFGRETDGATLGLDELTEDLILSRCLDLSHADTAALRALVESMVALAIDWQRRLAGGLDEGRADAPVAGSERAPDTDFGIRV